MQLIPVALAATMAGLLLAPFYQLPLIASCFALVLFICCCWLVRRNPVPAAVCLFGIFFLLAHLRYPLQFSPDPVVEKASEQTRQYRISGVVNSVRPRNEGRSQLDVSVQRLFDRDRSIALERSFLMRVYLGQGEAGILPGDKVLFNSRVRKPRLFGTPGEFHWPRYLASQGVAATGWVKSAELIAVEPSSGSSVMRMVAGLKWYWADQIEKRLAENEAQLVRALVLGESGVLPTETRQHLAAAGVSHLFAISGLHLGLLGMVGYQLLFLVYRRVPRLMNWQPPQRVLPLLLLPVLFAYLLLTGDAIATRRAFGLAVIGALLLLWRRRVNPMMLLMILAWLSLLQNPLLLWQPSWQLSFAGVAGILLWQPAWETRFARLPYGARRPLLLLLVSVAASLATLPLVLLNFHMIAPAGLLANLLCVPLVALLALPLGLLGLLLVPLAAPLADAAFWACGKALASAVLCADWLTSLPGLGEHFLYLSPLQMLAVLLVVLPALFVWQLRQRQWFLKLTALCFALSCLCGYGFAPRPTQTELIVFSVGQGEAMLLRSPQTGAILIDGGGLYSDRFDVGARLLAPALGYLGVAKLDAVLLTHDHPDHRKGLLSLLKHFPVDSFWSARRPEDLSPRLQQQLNAEQIPVRVFPSGWSEVNLWNHGKIDLFVNPEQQANKNDSSLILYLQQEGQGLLLTGDLEAKGVQALLAAGIPGPVSLLKLPHHGSRHSQTDLLVAQLHPQFCVVSCGYQNRYRFPARQVVELLEDENIPLFRTDQQGTIRVRRDRSQDMGWRIETWQDGLFR